MAQQMKGGYNVVKHEMNEMYSFWEDEIKNDSEYDDSFGGIGEMLDYIKSPPYNLDMQKTVDSINIRQQILSRTWNLARQKYYNKIYGK
jgi:hypothetical protein